MYTKSRTKGPNGNWGATGSYKFRGFIYNPAVTAKLSATTGINGTNNNKLISSEAKAKIWKFMKGKGLTN